MARYTYANANPLTNTDPTGHHTAGVIGRDTADDAPGGPKGAGEPVSSRGGVAGEPGPPPYRPVPSNPEYAPRPPLTPAGYPFGNEFDDVPPGWSPYGPPPGSGPAGGYGTPPGANADGHRHNRGRDGRRDPDAPSCGTDCAGDSPPPCNLTCQNLITPVDRGAAGSHTLDHRRRDILHTSTTSAANTTNHAAGKGVVSTCTGVACATTNPEQPTPTGGGSDLTPPNGPPPTSQSPADPDEPEDEHHTNEVHDTPQTATTSASDLLMPGGTAIGKPGTDATIREISGGLSDAQAMFSQLSRGGRVVADTSKLTRVELPAGGFVQLRTVMSRSPNTAATIDVNIPGLNISKLKYNP